MAKRLSQSAPLQQYNRLLISIKTLESALEAEGKKKEKVLFDKATWHAWRSCRSCAWAQLRELFYTDGESRNEKE